MSFPRYLNYRESGVDWLGPVPSHWIVTSLKRGYSVTLGKMLQPDATSPEDALLPYLRAANIQWSGVDCTDIKTMWFSKRDREQLQLKAGDLLVSEGGDVGRSALWKGEIDECYFQNSVNRVRPREGNLTSYLSYWMSTMKDKGFIDVLCNKSTIAHFTAEKVGAVPVPLPPPCEQQDITSFLNDETAKIDALVEEQRSLIELLKEKRQAVIARVVTKGLDPNVPTRDSGIEWIGEVPAQWSVTRLGYFATVENGTTPSRDTSAYWADGDVPWLSSGEVNKLYVNASDEFITQVALQQCSLRLLPAGTVIVGLIGQGKTRGLSALLQIDATINQNLAAICLGPKAVSKYFLYLFHAMYEWLREAGRGGNQAAMNCEILRSLKIPVPPVAEQTDIAAFIDSQLAGLDALRDEAELTMSLLGERRSALISAAVTGKIDVRSLASRTDTVAA